MEEFKSNLVNSVLALEAENKRLEAKVRDLQDELNQEKSKRSRWMTEVNVLHLVLNQCGVRITEVDLSQLMGAPNRQANIEEYMRKMHKERIAVESRPGELFSPEQEQRICELAHNAAQQPVNQYSV